MIEYRKATLDDIDELVRLRIAFMKEAQNVQGCDRDAAMTETLRQYFQSTMSECGFIAWLALEQGRIVGTSGLIFYNLVPSYKHPSGKNAYIMNMYTIPEFRSQGIAKRLFEMVMQEAVNRGYQKISLHATEMGRPLYRKFGFEEVGSEMVYNLE